MYYLRVARDRVTEELQAQVVHLGFVVLWHVRPVLGGGGVVFCLMVCVLFGQGYVGFV